MSKITGLKTGKTREKRINVYLDGKLALKLLKEVALKEGLRVGQEISDERLAALAGLNDYQRCYNAAVRSLGVRPRSEAEIRQRLQKRSFSSECIEKALARLKVQSLIDDEAFARFWKDNRDEFSPRSRSLTRMELKRKGLDGDIIDQVVGELDDGDSAYRAALKRARHLNEPDFQAFRQRLGAYLGRRGFSYGIIDATTRRIWRESHIVKT